jgi:hypothetical protein
MGGSTGNIRTLRNQSGTNGSRTIGSIIASDSGAGAGSVRRIFGFYQNQGYQNFYGHVLNLNYGGFKDRSKFFLSNGVS